MLKAVLWDIDGTLIDSEPAHDEAVMRALEELRPVGFQDKNAADLDMLGTTWDETWSRCGGNPAQLSLFEDTVAHYYLESLPTLQPRENALETVFLLQEMGVIQATVSNSKKVVVEGNINRLGLNKIVSVRVCREDVTRPKPDPEAFLHAASRLGLDPSCCAVVEDSPRGILAAKRAGAVTIFWPQSIPPSEPDCDYRIDDIQEIDWPTLFGRTDAIDNKKTAGGAS